MICLTRLNKKVFVVNAELIKMIEETPDTMITLTSGDHFMVRESVQEVVDKAVDYVVSGWSSPSRRLTACRGAVDIDEGPIATSREA
ncbi:MAG: flagellar FlbD family protein [Planctomycetota bacterium]|jgi:flagellar protein FlbD